MSTLVDIQMPIKKCGFIVGDVINVFLKQDVDWMLYINANDDLGFTDDEKNKIKLTAESAKEEETIMDRIRIASKRNELRELGGSPYIYLADADVLLPDKGTIFKSMFTALERYPQLGTLGMPYLDGYHVGAGSMMLRRENFFQIGDIKGGGSYCTCGYISHKLLEFGFYTVPFKTARATHLKAKYSSPETVEEWQGYAEIKVADFDQIDKIPIGDGKICYALSKEKLDEIAKENKETGFRLLF